MDWQAGPRFGFHRRAWSRRRAAGALRSPRRPLPKAPPPVRAPSPRPRPRPHNPIPAPAAPRQRRIREMRDAAARPRFGALEEISGADFVRRVTDASRGHPVVVLLYKPAHAGCGLLEGCLRALAPRHTGTCFLKIVSTSCIPDYPDANLPTLLVYAGGACKKQVVGLAPYGGARATPEQAALALASWGAIDDGGDGGGGDEDGSGGGGGRGLGGGGLVKGLVQRFVEQREREQEARDESSDFDG